MSVRSADIGLFTPDYYQDPHPVLARLRDAAAAVHEFTFPVGDIRMKLLTRYEDVRTLLADGRFSTQGRTWARQDFRDAGLVTGAGTVLQYSLPVIDMPFHTEVRRLAMPSFTPARSRMWRDRIEGFVQRALDRCAQLGEFDVMDDFAADVTAQTVGALLGFPENRFAELAHTIEQGFPTDPALMDQVPIAFGKVCAYARELIDEKRARPGQDLTSDFVAAADQEGGIGEDYLEALVAVVILGGADSSRSFIGNSVLALLDHPGQWRGEEPAASPVGPEAVEELLRYTSSQASAFIRFATQDCDLLGVPVEAGTPVLASLLAANHDPEVYPEPGKLDFARQGPRHLGLGHGLHNCLGAAMARLQGEVALGALTRRFPGLELAMPRAEVRYAEHWFMRRVIALPVSGR
ncbi:cytochrome P450 [Streptomyces sp. NPDC002952]|uniref:cytochrome P450 n=1 Tax=Streptomyces sp. NPDC002952 TaxID=3364673 RepID=UPI0036C77D1B